MEKNLNLKRAINLVRNEGFKIRQAAKACEVPYATIQRKLKANYDVYIARGSQPILNEEHENQLENIILILIRRAMNPTAKTVIDYANDILIHFYPDDYVEEHYPLRRSWFRGFVNRHTQLRYRKLTYMDKGHVNLTEKTMRWWFR